MKAIILTRVSTQDQEEGHSLAAQGKRLEEYCQKKGLEVIKAFEIVESSTSGNRKQFHEMIEFVRRRKEKTAIIADAVDRVQRSFKEVPILNELVQEDKTELHFLRESMIVSKNCPSHCELMWYFAVMGARSYALNIRDNVKRSQNYKLQRGEWCWMPPIGYKSITDPVIGKKGLAVDWERAPLIEQLFFDYAIRGLSLRALVPVAKTIGLRGRSGSILNKSHIEHILKNPFYIGFMKVTGYPLLEHHYETFIDTSLFYACEQKFKDYGKKPFKYAAQPFVLRGLIKCGLTGRVISGEKKRKKSGIEYIYLAATNPDDPKKRKYVPESVVLDQIKSVLDRLEFDKNTLAVILEALKSSHAQKTDYHTKRIQAMRAEYDQLQVQLDRGVDLLFKGSITEDDYAKKVYQLKHRQKEIEKELGDHTDADQAFLLSAEALFRLASQISGLFDSSTDDQKRQIIQLVFSNLTLKGEKLEYALHIPFNLFLKNPVRTEWRSRQDSNL